MRLYRNLLDELNRTPWIVSAAQAEHRRIGADAECEGKYGGQCKGGPGAQGSCGVTQILSQLIEESDAAAVAAFFLALLHDSQGAQSGEAGLFAAHASRGVLLRLAIQMVFELCVQFALNLCTPERGTQAQTKSLKPAHT